MWLHAYECACICFRRAFSFSLLTPWVYLCATSLQNLAVPHDFCFPLSVPLERFCWPRIRWCGSGGFQEHGQCFFIGLNSFISATVFYYFSLSLLPVYRLVLWGWGLWTDRMYTTLSQPCTAYLFNNNTNSRSTLLFALITIYQLFSRLKAARTYVAQHVSDWTRSMCL